MYFLPLFGIVKNVSDVTSTNNQLQILSAPSSTIEQQLPKSCNATNKIKRCFEQIDWVQFGCQHLFDNEPQDPLVKYEFFPRDSTANQRWCFDHFIQEVL